jgi:hypothetical protein
MWLTGRLAPDFKAIADFRHDIGVGIRNVCRRFVAMCRQLKLFSQVIVAIDGSKFKTVNNRDKNYIQHKLEQRMKQIDESIERYMSALETADRTQSAEADPVAEAKTQRLKEKINQQLSHCLGVHAGAAVCMQRERTRGNVLLCLGIGDQLLGHREGRGERLLRGGCLWLVG